MKVWTVVACIAVVPVLSIGCDATSRYKVLSVFFDGVPPPKVAEAPEPKEATNPETPQPRQVGYREHGPYAARLCNACHESAATNALVLPRDQLCFKCHEFRTDKKYVHGPLASGGCTACHDPHSSQYRYLLVSESDSFCFYCHDRDRVLSISAHEGIEQQCTTCHDPHMSDKKYLLR
jgi:predicted CXXCH cytochrome family protein